MWATIRLLRAIWYFGPIFASYMLQLGLAKVFGARRLRKRWTRVHQRNARRLYRGFVKLRGVFIKLGQILSVMGTFLPRVFVEHLEGLQDEVPPQSYKKAARSFERHFGRKPTEVFRRFETRPIASASLAQVHEAEDDHGRRLAVKILYPNVATIIKVDLRVFRWAIRVYNWFVPVQQLHRVAEQLEDMLARETDLVNEARCIDRMAENFADDPDVVLPEVVQEYTCRDVLTMTFMDGVKITRHAALEELELDPYDVATKLIQTFYKQLFADRFFHADPHPGNFFVQRGPEGQPRIVILDLGSASVVTDNLADGMLSVLTGLMTRNDDKVVEGIETMGFVAEDGDRELLERTTRKYFEKLLDIEIEDFGKIDPEVAEKLRGDVKRDELRELMKSIQFPVGWFYVERAVVIMFGLSTQLAPKMNTIRVGFPYIMKFLAEQQSRKAARAREAAPAEKPDASTPAEGVA